MNNHESWMQSDTGFGLIVTHKKYDQHFVFKIIIITAKSCTPRKVGNVSCEKTTTWMKALSIIPGPASGLSSIHTFTMCHFQWHIFYDAQHIYKACYNHALWANLLIISAALQLCTVKCSIPGHVYVLCKLIQTRSMLYANVCIFRYNKSYSATHIVYIWGLDTHSPLTST